MNISLIIDAGTPHHQAFAFDERELGSESISEIRFSALYEHGETRILYA